MSVARSASLLIINVQISPTIVSEDRIWGITACLEIARPRGRALFNACSTERAVSVGEVGAFKRDLHLHSTENSSRFVEVNGKNLDVRLNIKLL